MARVGVHGAFGVRAALDAPSPIGELLADALADLRLARRTWRPATPLWVRRHEDRFDVWWRHELHVWDVDGAGAVSAVLSVLNDSVSAAVSMSHLVLHAGVVDIAGAAVAFVGPSGSGKSTLTAAAVGRGHGFIGDELGIVSDDGVARAFHRPIGLRAPSVAALQLPLAPCDLHAIIAPVRASSLGRLADRVPLRLVVLLRPHSLDLEPRWLSPAQAMFELLNQTIGTELVEPATFDRIERLVRRVPVLELSRAEPASMLVEIERALG
ncbi:MAG: hypothetical protein WCI22_00345 [Actinomycetota bacterium]